MDTWTADNERDRSIVSYSHFSLRYLVVFQGDMIETRIDRRCSTLRPVGDAISGISRRRRSNFLSLCNALQMTIAGIKKIVIRNIRICELRRYSRF